MLAALFSLNVPSSEQDWYVCVRAVEVLQVTHSPVTCLAWTSMIKLHLEYQPMHIWRGQRSIYLNLDKAMQDPATREPSCARL